MKTYTQGTYSRYGKPFRGKPVLTPEEQEREQAELRERRAKWPTVIRGFVERIDPEQRLAKSKQTYMEKLDAAIARAKAGVK